MKNANLPYIYITCILLFVNMTVSPAILWFRKSMQQNKFIIYCFDSFLDLLYLSNNLLHSIESEGGDNYNTKITGNEHSNDVFWINVAIGYPAFSIILRLRAVYRASISDKNVLKKNASFVRQVSNSAKMSKDQVKKIYYTVEKCIYTIVILLGISFFAAFIFRVEYQLDICYFR